MITRTTLFPALILALQLGAGIMYACDADIRHAAYWLFAAGLTVAVTF